MQLSYNWLKELVKTSLSCEEMAHALTFAGLEVEDIKAFEDDHIFSAEVTSNRPDWLSHFGVAREIHACTGEGVTFPEPDLSPVSEKIEKYFELAVEDAELCPRYTGRLLVDVKVKTSPDWLSKRIRSLGLRPVNNIVDVTNLVLFECGQPLHAFDFDKLAGGKIVVRRARAGETITAIDGKKRELDADMLVIADGERPVAIAGVMGGLDTEVSGSTKRVLIESARFHSLNVRKTSRKLGLVSDSSFRFERGIDPERVDWASRRTCRLIMELAGAKLLSGVADENHEKDRKLEVALRYARTNHLLGLEIAPEIQKEILVRLGLAPVKEEKERITLGVPSHRYDVEREADLIEEVARIHGYDRIPETSTMGIALAEESFTQHLEERIKERLVATGLFEVYTYSFATEEDKDIFCPWTEAEPLRAQGGLYHEGKPLRRSILPSLLEVLKINCHRGNKEVRIFEVANIFLPTKGRPLPDEQKSTSALVTCDYYELKGILDSLLEDLGPTERVSYRPCNHPFFEEKRGAEVFAGKSRIGYIGEVASRILEAYDSAKPVSAFEINLNALEGFVTLEKRYSHLPKFPAIERDMALVVDMSVGWDEVLNCIESTDSSILERVAFMDEYLGKQVPRGKKSLAISLIFRAPDRTLRAEEVEEVEAKILEALDKKLGAKLRDK